MTSRQQPLRLTVAIQLAGGVKTLADIDIHQIEILRLNRDGSQQNIEVNLWDLLQTEDTQKDVILQEGKTIMISRANNISPEESGNPWVR